MLILGFRAIGSKIKNQHLNQIYTVICDLVSYRAGEIEIGLSGKCPCIQYLPY